MLEMFVRSAFILNRMAHRHVKFLGASLVVQPGAASLEERQCATLKSDHASDKSCSDEHEGHTFPSKTESVAPPRCSAVPQGYRLSPSNEARQDIGQVFTPSNASCINLYLSLHGGRCVMNVLVDSSSWQVLEAVYQPRGVLKDRWVYKDWFYWQDQLWHPRSIQHWSRGQVMQAWCTSVAERLRISGTAPFDMSGFKSRPSGV